MGEVEREKEEEGEVHGEMVKMIGRAVFCARA